MKSYTLLLLFYPIQFQRIYLTKIELVKATPSPSLK